MGYRQSKVIPRQLIEKAMDSINPTILSLGTHVVEIDRVQHLNDDRLCIHFKNTSTKLYTQPDAFAFKSLIASVSYNDRDLLWSLTNDKEYHLLCGLQVKTLIDISWGYLLIKNNEGKYGIVSTKDNTLTEVFTDYKEAVKRRDELGRSYLVMSKFYPTKRQILQNNNDRGKQLSMELHGASPSRSS